VRTRLKLFFERVEGSYWFVPSVMALAATGLAFGVVAVDTTLGADWLDRYTWVYANKPGGARALLGAIAGSMITVAGVVFSTTIAAVTYATSQFGPRLLTNFMHDRANQVVLGTFTATFLYCLLVLRTIRSADEDAGGAFVPHLGIIVGVLMAVASIGVLIYFVHHTPQSVHASHVAARIARELREHLEKRFPERLAAEAGDGRAVEDADWRRETAALVPAQRSGYLQHVDPVRLLKVAERHDLVVYLPLGPGAFVAEGTAVAAVAPADRLGPDVLEGLGEALVIGSERTPTQDTLFLVDELVEITGRALSPGINDPFTAITCLDWLFAAAVDLSRRHDPAARRYDEDGCLRVVAQPVTFVRVAEHAFEAAWPYVARDHNAALHALRGLARVGAALTEPADRACVRTLAGSLHTQATAVLAHHRPALDDALADVHRMLGTLPAAEHLDVLRRAG
jgi:uncharacterized membrane protein